MDLTPKFHNQYEEFRVLDAHTEGEPARIILSGIPMVEGTTMMEKKQFIMEHCDYIRTSLCFEPRGHKDMLCVALVEPVHDAADFGVLFLESGGVVNMCGHGAIATAVAVVEAGLVERTEPVTHVCFDVPAGMISINVNIRNGKAVSTDLENVPTFSYREELSTVDEGYGTIQYDLEFSGSFCALVDADQFGMKLDSILGCRFTCRIDRTTKVGNFDAIIPVITGGAYIDGYNCWLIDPDDPFGNGFLLGM